MTPTKGKGEGAARLNVKVPGSQDVSGKTPSEYALDRSLRFKFCRDCTLTVGSDSKDVDPTQAWFRSRLYEYIKGYKNGSPANLLALNNGKWKIPVENIDTLLDIYLAEYESVPFGLVFLKSPIYPYPMDLDHLEDASSVGPPLVVVKVILETLADVLGEKAELVKHVHFEHRLESRFHAYFHRVIVDEKTAVKLRQAHVAALDKKFPEVGHS